MNKSAPHYADSTLRRCHFTPFRKGAGPTFALTLWDTGRTGNYGKAMLGYKLTMKEPRLAKSIILFEGEDFECPNWNGNAIDSDSAVEGIMGFLTLRPGDTDDEYFANYTAIQREYCAAYAEALSLAVSDRYCDPETGAVRS